ncbi:MULTISPECIES: beta-eliminating lyase-related protein [unclassified Paenibacillus]|uniref:threonine aldolase family protein n=1 Tax=unclassified Paenibacillus TaxID=185978 RepID=UPI0003E21E37|nr:MULTISPECIES: beta-eliminating lyase-related protein [unclassified Paenibacillus]ETT55107.1 aromatic amino acid beta-eliminating lyase/threonine aldolase [Paenibacillus sp. FSL R7-269]OMF98100.1 low specificity L-threonine aldolase [Paenibacillus sp. FSL R7-0337]
MNQENALMEAFGRTQVQLAGHGGRDAAVLKKALASVEDSLAADMYGTGTVIEEFQAEMAEVLGKECSVFFPSGTMAQQIALRIWSDREGSKRVAYHPLCHLEIHEQDGLKELHHLEPLLLGGAGRLITLEDVKGMGPGIACLLLELPQREIGGQLPEYTELEAISAYCREQGIRLHLDGARLFEVLPYYGKTAAEVCALFDSVYVSLYKGIGGIAGAILAGSREFTEESKIWKRRHGGDLISLYPYIVPARYYYQQRISRMSKYYEQAKELAALFNSCDKVSTLPEVPVSNMFHIHFALSQEQLAPVLIGIYNETGIGLTPRLKPTGENACYYELNIGDVYGGVSGAALRQAFRLLDERLKQL